jgi:hypothetical protein
MAKEFVGTGWENQGGIKVRIKKEDIMDLPVNDYGYIELFVGRRREKDEKSGATHYVKPNTPRQT